jgi:hypothetical protein
MNIRSTNDNQQQTSNDIGLGKLRRSNTVAFSSIRAKASNNSILNILDDEQDIKPRLTSFHASTKPPPPVRMDLFDLTDDDQVLKSPTSLQFNASNFKPLVPIVSPISPATSTTVTNRRNTLPARTRPDATTVLTNGGLDIDDDEFGDFTGEQDNDFGDFTTTTTTSRVTFNNNDDPFGILSCIQPSSHQSKSMSTSQPPSTMILTPTTSSPKVIEESFFDLLSPIETASTVQTDVDLFDFNADITSTNAVTDQNNAAKVPVENKIDNDDDDDWGDWAF